MNAARDLDDMHRLRAELRAARRSLSGVDQAMAGARITAEVRSLSEWRSAEIIALYVATDGEVDPAALVEAARHDGKIVTLPVVEGDDMRFRLADELVPGPFGIVQPAPSMPLVSVETHDLVILPLVGLDRFGNRLGRGGGFYDRVFSDVGNRPIRCGIAHDLQLVDHIETHDADVPLHLAVTPSQVLRFRQGSG